MKISLILCSVNRIQSVENFFNSLLLQTFKNYEVVVIDQNRDNRLDKIIDKFSSKLSIKVLKTTPGLSKSRNLGLKNIDGDIVCFPDDDCKYTNDLLFNVNEYFQENGKIDFILGKTIDPKTKLFSAGKNILQAGKVKCYHFGGSSTSLFIRLRSKDVYFHFDEKFGIGAEYPAEEENDLIMRLVNMNRKGMYLPENIIIHHPNKDDDYTNINRGIDRGLAFGALIAKHLFTSCGLIYFFNYLFFRIPFSIIAACIKLEKTKYHYLIKKYFSTWRGFCIYLKENYDKRI